ncbi:MAG: aminoglycoside phosphotransferase family protein [Oceanibaculum sp.]
MTAVQDTSRTHLISAFLARAGWQDATLFWLPGDASFRRYARLTRGSETAMLMDAPPPVEDVRPFITVAEHLLRLGQRAPRILARDAQAGLLLLEDFGDTTFTRALAAGTPEEPLYRDALDLLIGLHRHADAASIALPAYDDALFLREAHLLTDWYLPAVAPAVAADANIEAARADLTQALTPLLALARQVPQTLVLRDYHVDNLMLLPGTQPGGGPQGLGLLDFQDAVIGPVTYDLVSLLEDARRDVSPALAAAMLGRYAAAFPEIDPAALDLSCRIMGAQRSMKIVGIFTRLSRRDGKHRYLTHIPRLWRLIARDLDHPDLAPLRAWLDATIPPAIRMTPETPA